MEENVKIPDLDDMLTSGELSSQARFQASLIAKLIQAELHQISERARYSIEDLIIRARGDSYGCESINGRGRASLVVAALASLHGSTFDLIESIIVVTLKNRDIFSIDNINGKNLLSKQVISAMFQSGLLDDDMYKILNDDFDLSSLKIEVGSFVENKENENKINSAPMTATERLERRRSSWCNIILSRLPPSISLAEIVRVDEIDGTVKFRDFFDHSNGGWVEISGVSLVSTTRQSDLVKSKKRGLQNED